MIEDLNLTIGVKTIVAATILPNSCRNGHELRKSVHVVDALPAKVLSTHLTPLDDSRFYYEVRAGQHLKLL